MMLPGQNRIPVDNDNAFQIYNQQLIKLSSIPDEQRLNSPTHTAKAYSPICGSTVEVDLILTPAQKISAFGYRVDACALTKSVLAVMTTAIIGQGQEQIKTIAQQMQKMLEGEKPQFPPAWQELMILMRIKDHKARHNAVMLPFEALEKAFKIKG